MDPARLSFGDYLRAAFRQRANVPLLGSMPVNLMALGTAAVLGLANPGFWLLGAAAEIAYLFFVAGNPRYQKLVRGERLLEAQHRWEQRIHGEVQQLGEADRERYRGLLEQCRRVLGLSDTLDTDSLGSFRDLRSRSLNQLLAIFLRLLRSRQLIADNVEGLDRQALEGEIAGLEERLAKVEADGSDPALERSLRGSLEIQRRRLANHERAAASLRVIDAELKRIERQAELLREEAAVSGGPLSLSERLDEVTSAMTETSRWMDEQAELLGPLGGPESAPLADLPSLPRVTEGEGG